MFKQDRLEYARACEERSLREIAVEKAKADAKAKKIEEIKQWRLQHTLERQLKAQKER